MMTFFCTQSRASSTNDKCFFTKRGKLEKLKRQETFNTVHSVRSLQNLFHYFKAIKQRKIQER